MMSPAVTFLLLVAIQCINSAHVGDGTRSLYTGQSIDPRDSRGSCQADGTQYPSETSIPREHPCHYCICYKSKVSCFWKQCSAPPPNCETMNFENVCNPSLYVCGIPPEAREEPQLSFGDRLNSFRFFKRKRRSTSDLSRRLPHIEEPVPIEFEEAWNKYQTEHQKRSIRDLTALDAIHGDTSCQILGVKYLLGEVIGVASDICMECRCAAGSMFCSPKCCFQPAPFSISRRQQSSLLQRSRTRGNELRSHPLHYIRNQYVSSNFL